MARRSSSYACFYDDPRWHVRAHYYSTVRVRLPGTYRQPLNNGADHAAVVFGDIESTQAPGSRHPYWDRTSSHAVGWMVGVTPASAGTNSGHS